MRRMLMPSSEPASVAHGENEAWEPAAAPGSCSVQGAPGSAPDLACPLRPLPSVGSVH